MSQRYANLVSIVKKFSQLILTSTLEIMRVKKFIKMRSPIKIYSFSKFHREMTQKLHNHAKIETVIEDCQR